jgi:hypothetical protein
MYDTKKKMERENIANLIDKKRESRSEDKLDMLMSSW